MAIGKSLKILLSNNLGDCNLANTNQLVYIQAIEYGKSKRNTNSTAEFLIFQIEGKEQDVEVYYKDKTVWQQEIERGII